MKRVLVTGGSRGIGAAAVRKFTSAGDRVVFTYNNSEAEAKALEKETGAVAVRADTSCPDEVRRSVAEAVSLMGTVDVLVTCAGVAKIAQICDVSDEDWKKICDTDLSGTFYYCREVSREMVKNHKGAIVTVGSVWGDVGASCETAYSAAKAGVRGLTMALSKELAPSGITVNCVAPGVIDTEMNAILYEDDRKALCEEIPMGRFGTANEVAECIFFLASDGAAYITGQTVGVGGGF